MCVPQPPNSTVLPHSTRKVECLTRPGKEDIPYELGLDANTTYGKEAGFNYFSTSLAYGYTRRESFYVRGPLLSKMAIKRSTKIVWAKISVAPRKLTWYNKSDPAAQTAVVR